MKAKIKNKTLHHAWEFDISKAPAFPGKLQAMPTDSDRLLIGGCIDPDYTEETLFLVSRNRFFIKRFSGPGLKDLFVQISHDQAGLWLFRNGLIEFQEEIDVRELLKKAVYVRVEERKVRDQDHDCVKNQGLEWPSSFRE